MVEISSSNLFFRVGENARPPFRAEGYSTLWMFPAYSPGKSAARSWGRPMRPPCTVAFVMLPRNRASLRPSPETHEPCTERSFRCFPPVSIAGTRALLSVTPADDVVATQGSFDRDHGSTPRFLAVVDRIRALQGSANARA